MRRIDPKLLPAVAAVDTGVILRALGEINDAEAAQCKAFWKAMVEGDEHRVIHIAMPSYAEILRHKDGKAGVRVPRTPRVVVVPADDRVAVVIAEKMPMNTVVRFKDGERCPQAYIHYDALILACAVRHRADCFVGLCTIIALRGGALVRRSALHIKAGMGARSGQKWLSLRGGSAS